MILQFSSYKNSMYVQISHISRKFRCSNCVNRVQDMFCFPYRLCHCHRNRQFQQQLTPKCHTAKASTAMSVRFRYSVCFDRWDELRRQFQRLTSKGPTKVVESRVWIQPCSRVFYGANCFGAFDAFLHF